MDQSQLGQLELNKSRRLLTGMGAKGDSLYAVPTATGRICFASRAVAGCVRNFNDSAGGVAWNVYDDDYTERGDPPVVVGLIPNSIRKVQVIVSGVAHDATIGENAFWYELSDGSLPMGAVGGFNVTYADGAMQKISVSVSSPPVTDR